MNDKKKFNVGRLALLLCSTCALMYATTTAVKAQNSGDETVVCEITTSVKTQGFDGDKTGIQLSKSSGKKDDITLTSRRTPSSHNATCSIVAFLRENISYSPKAIEAKIQGDIIVGFTVTKEGIMTNRRIIKTLYPALDMDVLEAVKKMPVPEFTKKDGQKADSNYKITLKFALPGDISQTKPTVEVVEVETENLKMTLMKREKKEGANSGTIAIFDDSSAKKDTTPTITGHTTTGTERNEDIE